MNIAYNLINVNIGQWSSLRMLTCLVHLVQHSMVLRLSALIQEPGSFVSWSSTLELCTLYKRGLRVYGRSKILI
jgi:hypothetical protein